MKRKKIITFILTGLIGVFAPVLKGQDIAETAVREKVVFYTDRNLYLTGENIWSKASVSVDNAGDNKQLSNVLYLELYLNKQAVVKKKFQIVNGVVEGMLPIPEEIYSANYYLRAYTQYQRNFPAGTFFTSLITIINPELPYQKSKTRPEKLIEIVPEGGQILSGLPAKIALNINPNLVKVIENSTLTDQYENEIRSFQLSKNGLSLIGFTPVDTLDYFLRFKLNNGDTVSEPLPKTNGNGIVISEDRENHEVHFYAGPDYLKNNGPGHRLLVYTADGNQVKEIKVSINKPEQKIDFDVASQQEGFYHLAAQQ